MKSLIAAALIAATAIGGLGLRTAEAQSLTPACCACCPCCSDCDGSDCDCDCCAPECCDR